MKILLIDDEQSLIDIFTQTFKTAGFEVVGAESGNEGILKAQTEHPDIIFLDQVLPDINGNQVLQMLKQDVETKDIPVAMLSNFNQNGMVRDAINLGAVDYILKYQIDPQDLIRKANQIVGSHTKIADAVAAVTPVPQATTPTPVVPTQPQPQPMTDYPLDEKASTPIQSDSTPPPAEPQPVADRPLDETSTQTPPIAPMPTPIQNEELRIMNQGQTNIASITQPTPQIPSMETLTHNEPIIPEVPQMPSTSMPDMPNPTATNPPTSGSINTLAQNGVVTPIPPVPDEPEVIPQSNPTTTQATEPTNTQ